MKKLWGRKTAQAVTILGGSDGPTSVFLAGKFTRQTFLRSLKGRYMDSRMKRRRARVIKHLAAEPHTPKELERYLKKKYHAREYAPSSSRAKEGFKNTKSSIVWREHGKDMQQLGYPPPETKCPNDLKNREAVEQWHRYMYEYDEAALGLSDSLVPMDYHIYGIPMGEGSIQVEIEKVRGLLNVSFSAPSGKRGCAQSIMRDIYRYYGVTKKDMEESSDRYLTLVTILADLPGKRCCIKKWCKGKKKRERRGKH